MADVLKQDGRYWALDKLCLGYATALAALIAVYWKQIPQAGELLALHAAGIVLIVLSVKLPGRVSWYVHHLYVLPFGGSCYREMALLIPAIRRTTADQWLANLDFAFWHANPTVWLERLQTAGPHGVPPGDLHAVYPRGSAHPLAVVAAAALHGLLLLRVPANARVSGFLRRVHDRA